MYTFLLGVQLQVGVLGPILWMNVFRFYRYWWKFFQNYWFSYMPHYSQVGRRRGRWQLSRLRQSCSLTGDLNLDPVEGHWWVAGILEADMKRQWARFMAEHQLQKSRCQGCPDFRTFLPLPLLTTTVMLHFPSWHPGGGIFTTKPSSLIYLDFLHFYTFD